MDESTQNHIQQHPEWFDENGCLKPVDYLNFFVECSICGCMVKRYHTTMLIISKEFQCYYCLHPDRYKREEHPKDIRF